MRSGFLTILLFFGIITRPVAQPGEFEINSYALEADSLDILARKCMINSKHDSAKIFLDKATELALVSRNPIIIARCYIDYANMYNLRTKFNEAEKYINLARPYLAIIKHYNVKITGLLLQAHLFNVTGRKDSAIYYYRQAETFNNESGESYRNYVVYMSLAELYNQLNDVEGTENNFDKAYALTSRKEGKPDHGYLLIAYINYHLNREKAGGAGKLIVEYDELLEERKKNKFEDPLQNVIMNLTGTRLESSVEFMKQVRGESISKKEILQAVIADVYITRYYERRKNFTEAVKYISEAEDLAAQSASIIHLYETRRMKFDLLQKAGRFDEAAKTAEFLFTLKDSILALEKREQVYALEKKYESEKKEKEIELLASQKELNEKEIALLTSDKKLSFLLLQQELLQNKSLNRENLLMDSIVTSEKAYSRAVNSQNEKQTQLNAALDRENILKASQLKKEKKTKWILAGGTFLLLLSGITVLVFYRKQKKKSLIIQKQSADLEVLMKEIHHRVKNNLQVISSLLDLQSHTITDSQASEAVKEGKNRVQSMALIHQNLYSEGNIRGIKTKEYISNLLQSLCDSYNITNDKLKLHTEIDDLNLDVDTMIPLGLVLNELVSNSLKYAFNDGRPGELSIVLKEESQHLLLRVSDNGTGYPESLDTRGSKSFGMKMIRAFAQKLKAKLNIYNNQGAVVEMQITKYKTV